VVDERKLFRRIREIEKRSWSTFCDAKLIVPFSWLFLGFFLPAESVSNDYLNTPRLVRVA